MKNKIYSLAILMMGMAGTSYAQSEATASATATLVTPISIVKDVDMNFGTVAASATAGTVVLGTDNSVTPADGATVVGGTALAAEFTVTGEGTSSFSITLPTSITLVSVALDELIVDEFVSTPIATGDLVAGTAVVTVGATLNLPAAAPAGVYTNASDLVVTVNYN